MGSGSFLLPMMAIMFVVLALSAAGIGIFSLYQRHKDGESFSLAMSVTDSISLLRKTWGNITGKVVMRWGRHKINKQIRLNQKVVKANLNDFKDAVRRYGKISVPVPQQLIDDTRKLDNAKLVEVVCMLTVALQYHESCFGSDMIMALNYDFPDTELKERSIIAAKKRVAGIKKSKATNGKK